jgi:hypothetical protein
VRELLGEPETSPRATRPEPRRRAAQARRAR